MNITSFPENEYYDKNIYLIIFAAVDDHVVLIRVDELNVLWIPIFPHSNWQETIHLVAFFP